MSDSPEDTRNDADRRRAAQDAARERKREQSDLTQLTGLWKSKTRKGETMLAGPLGGARVLILPNERKTEGSSQPDYYLCVCPDTRKDREREPQGGGL